jgi:hypothetical protein
MQCPNFLDIEKERVVVRVEVSLFVQRLKTETKSRSQQGEAQKGLLL